MKRMDLAEFQAAGYLEEANRRFFHPLGLALAVNCPHPRPNRRQRVEQFVRYRVLRQPKVTLACIWEDREDLEGWYMAYRDEADRDLSRSRAAFIDAEFAHRAPFREALFQGNVIQPAGMDPTKP